MNSKVLSEKTVKEADGEWDRKVKREVAEDRDARVISSSCEIVRGDLDRDKFYEQYGVSVRKTKIGLGVIAERDFNAGEIVGSVDGISIYDPNYSSVWCIDGGSCILEPFAPFCYLNHSCEPNAGFFRAVFESGLESGYESASDQERDRNFDGQESGASRMTKKKDKAQKDVIPENWFADKKDDSQEERQIYIDENGVEFYWDTCVRDDCTECPDAKICRSCHEFPKQEKNVRAIVQVETLQPIRKGEEITVDYAWPASWAVPCFCGSENCRGWIVDKKERHLLSKTN